MLLVWPKYWLCNGLPFYITENGVAPLFVVKPMFFSGARSLRRFEPVLAPRPTGIVVDRAADGHRGRRLLRGLRLLRALAPRHHVHQANAAARIEVRAKTAFRHLHLVVGIEMSLEGYPPSISQ